MCFDPYGDYLCVSTYFEFCVYDIHRRTEIYRESLFRQYVPDHGEIGPVGWSFNGLTVGFEKTVLKIVFHTRQEFLQFIHNTLSTALLPHPLDEKLITDLVQSKYSEFGYSDEQWPAISDYIHRRYEQLGTDRRLLREEGQI